MQRDSDISMRDISTLATDSATSMSMKREMPRWWPVALIAFVSFLFFWPYFLLDQVLYAGDMAFVFIPFQHYSTSRLEQGELPLWNPHLFGGTPALAEAIYQVFYLPNVLLFLLGVPRGLSWILPLHLAFMGVGASGGERADEVRAKYRVHLE